MSFAAGEIRAALAQYTAALGFVDEDLMMQLDGPYLDHAHAARVPLLSNKAACHLKLEAWQPVIVATSELLQIARAEDTSMRGKAHFRRGTAKRALQQSDGAVEDYVAASRLCDSAVPTLCNSSSATITCPVPTGICA